MIHIPHKTDTVIMMLRDLLSAIEVPIYIFALKFVYRMLNVRAALFFFNLREMTETE